LVVVEVNKVGPIGPTLSLAAIPCEVSFFSTIEAFQGGSVGLSNVSLYPLVVVMPIWGSGLAQVHRHWCVVLEIEVNRALGAVLSSMGHVYYTFLLLILTHVAIDTSRTDIRRSVAHDNISV